LQQGCFKGEKIIASVIITPKKKQHPQKQGIRFFRGCRHLLCAYRQVLQLEPPFIREMPGRIIAFEGVKKKIYANAMFKSFSSALTVEENVRYISETLGVKPAVVCTYLLRTGLKTAGVEKLYNKLVAEGTR